ncbi:porin [Thalassospiraceae bacterium LMO-JJ14]|nr:porin [Thalassospiraceae bacterium LMO-JJ14]
MNIKTTLKASVAAAALFVVAVPVAEAANMEMSVSGHFNKGMWYYNNGEDAGVYQGDNGGSQTRARIVAKGKINEAMSVSGTSEWAMTASNESTLDPADANVNGNGTNGTEAGTDSFFTLRHNYVSFAHKQFGSVAIGHTSEATDGITENGGVGNLQYGSNMLFGGSVTLVNSSTKARAAGTDLGAFRVSADGTRSSVIRYNTPSMGGIVVGVSHTNEQNSAADVKFSGKFGGIGVKAGVGYKSTGASSTTQDSQWGGSAQLSHDSGLAVDFSYSKLDLVAGSTRTPVGWSVGVNYAADLTSMGTTTFRVAYSKSEDATAANDEIVGFMVGAEQSVAEGVAAYVGYQHDEVDQAAGVSYDAVTTVFAGTKVVF